VPWDSKVKYKFFVDGKWLLLRGQPTEMDPGGYINNIIFTPPKPASAAAAPSPEEVHVGTEEIAVVSPPEAVVMPVEQTPVVTVVAREEDAPVAEEPEKPASRLPILPLNSTEHNTIANGQAAPAPPDYVLPPSPRASRTLPTAEVVPPPAAEAHPVPDVHEDVVISPPEAENKPVDETPVVTVQAEANKEEASPKQDAPSRITTLPLLPVNSTEHNTINDSQVPAVPDFVLPPPPRAVAQAAAEESAKLASDAPVTPSDAPVVEDLSAVQADKDAMGELEALKEEQLNANGEVAEAQAPVVPVPESAPKPDSEAKEGAKNDVKEEHKKDASSTSSSSSSNSDSTKTNKDAGAGGALPSPPVTPPSKHKRYFSFPRPGSPTPSQGTNSSPPTRPPLTSSPSSRSGTMSGKKKRHSFIAKIKEIFHHDHDDKDAKKGKSESQEKVTEKA
jgi:hypothetical protein